MLTTNPHTAERQKEKVFHFIDTVDAQIRRNEDMNAFRNSDVYKLNLSKKECERGKEECLRHIIQKFYRGATPLSDEYKDAKFNDLCCDIDKHCPKGLLFYFREAIRKGECGKRCQKMIEGVEQAVESSYKDKMIHPEKYNEEDLVFRMDPDMQAHMDLLSKDLELEDISDLVRRSVQSTTMSEVKRAKEEKEQNQELEKELADDLSVTSESTLEYALSKRGLNQPKLFQPTLMHGILIGAADRVGDAVTESYNYHALEDYGLEGEQNSPMYEAFVECIREYTWLTLENSMFRKRPRTLLETRKMADEYARGVR